jgi:hypothetical protein
MSYDQVARLIGQPRDAGVSGADIHGRNTSDPRMSDVFLYFEMSADFDYSIHFSKGRVVIVEKY